VKSVLRVDVRVAIEAGVLIQRKKPIDPHRFDLQRLSEDHLGHVLGM
jgi:hypothetical protein